MATENFYLLRDVSQAIKKLKCAISGSVRFWTLVYSSGYLSLKFYFYRVNSEKVFVVITFSFQAVGQTRFNTLSSYLKQSAMLWVSLDS